MNIFLSLLLLFNTALLVIIALNIGKLLIAQNTDRSNQALLDRANHEILTLLSESVHEMGQSLGVVEVNLDGVWNRLFPSQTEESEQAQS